MASPKQTRKRLAVAERRNAALAMRIDGATYNQIATKLGYANRSGSYKAVADALRDVPRENAEQYKRLQIDRLERVLRSQFERLDDTGDPGAANAVLKVIEALDRYYGFERESMATSNAGTLLELLVSNSRAAMEQAKGD